MPLVGIVLSDRVSEEQLRHTRRERILKYTSQLKTFGVREGMDWVKYNWSLNCRVSFHFIGKLQLSLALLTILLRRESESGLGLDRSGASRLGQVKVSL